MSYIMGIIYSVATQIVALQMLDSAIYQINTDFKAMVYPWLQKNIYIHLGRSA